MSYGTGYGSGYAAGIELTDADPPPVPGALDVHSSTVRWYQAIGPGITSQDRTRLLLAWLDGPGHLLGAVDDIVRDRDSGIGWSRELDPELTSDIRWTGQFVGVQVPDGLTDTEARALVADRPSFRRGSVRAIRDAAAALLTGSRYVGITERDGSPYRLTVTTYTTETPDPAAVEAAVRAQKPAGLLLQYAAVSPMSYLAAEQAAPQTYTELEAQPALTYTDLEASA